MPAPGKAATFKSLPFEGSKPPAATLFKNHLEVTGGEAAWKDRRSMMTTGTISVPSVGLTGTVTVYAMDPDRMVMTIEMPGIGLTRAGFDGTTGWSMDPMRGPAIMEPSQVEDLKREAHIQRDADLARDPGDAEVIDLVDFYGTPAWQVRVKPKGGSPTMHYYAKETGVQIGMQMTTLTQMGPIPVVMSMQKYQDFDGVKMPSKVVTSMMMQSQEITTDKVEWNKVDAAVFELPAEIKALVEARKKAAVTGGPATGAPGSSSTSSAPTAPSAPPAGAPGSTPPASPKGSS